MGIYWRFSSCNVISSNVGTASNIYHIKMKYLILLFVLAAATYAEEKNSAATWVIEVAECAATAKDFMEKAQCFKDMMHCISEKCRIPECYDAHKKCRLEAKGFKDYFICNVKYIKCMYIHRHERCKDIQF